MPQDGSVQPYDSRLAQLTEEARAKLAERETPGIAVKDPVISVDAPGSSAGKPGQPQKARKPGEPVSVPLLGDVCRKRKSSEAPSF